MPGSFAAVALGFWDLLLVGHFASASTLASRFAQAALLCA